MYLLSFLDRGKTLSLEKHTVKCRKFWKLNKIISVHCATLCRKAKLIETILWGKDICNTFSNGPYKNFHLMVLHRYPIKDQVTITKRLEQLQNMKPKKNKIKLWHLFPNFSYHFQVVLENNLKTWIAYSQQVFKKWICIYLQVNYMQGWFHQLIEVGDFCLKII